MRNHRSKLTKRTGTKHNIRVHPKKKKFYKDVYGERNCGSGVSRGWNMFSWLPWLFFQKVDLGCQILKQDQRQVHNIFVDNTSLWLLFTTYTVIILLQITLFSFHRWVESISVFALTTQCIWVSSCISFFKFLQKGQPQRSHSD